VSQIVVTDQYYFQILLHIGPDFQLTPDMWAIVKKMVVNVCGLYRVTRCRMHLVDWQTCRPALYSPVFVILGHDEKESHV